MCTARTTSCFDRDGKRGGGEWVAVMTRQSYKTRRREVVKHDPTITSRPLHGSLAHDGGDALARAGVGPRRQGQGLGDWTKCLNAGPPQDRLLFFSLSFSSCSRSCSPYSPNIFQQTSPHFSSLPLHLSTGEYCAVHAQMIPDSIQMSSNAGSLAELLVPQGWTWATNILAITTYR